MISYKKMVKLLMVALLVLFSMSSYAGWRQGQTAEQKVEADGNNQKLLRSQQNSKKNTEFRYEQPKKSSAGFRADSNSSPQRKTTSGFRLDNSRYQKADHKSSYQLDKRHQHRRYYPRQGTRLKSLPRGYRTVLWHGTRYYFFEGSWYLSSSSDFFVILPPVGLLVPFLPSFYTTIWIGSVPYYYAGGVYYVWEPVHRAYRVSDIPAQEEVVEQAQLPRRLFIYPTQGQSEQKQATDRYECHSWAKSQADFDPTLPTDDIPAEEISQRGDDYNRAMKACLVARGYSVE